MDIQFTESDEKRMRSIGVVAAYLFGSRAVGREGPNSDFDFAFLMDRAGYRRGGDAHAALYDLVTPHCKRASLENDVIDIVFLNDAPLELRSHVVRHGKLIFDDKPVDRARYEQKTMLLAADFRPVLDEVDQTILASL